VIVKQRVFVNCTENVTSRNVISNFVICWCEIPFDLTVKSLCVDTARNVDGFRHVGNGFEGCEYQALETRKNSTKDCTLTSLDTIVDVTHKTCKASVRLSKEAARHPDFSPGPNSTESGLPVRSTGSPIDMPEVCSTTLISAQ